MDLVEKEYRKLVAKESERLMKVGRKTNASSFPLSGEDKSKPAWPTPRKSKKAN